MSVKFKSGEIMKIMEHDASEKILIFYPFMMGKLPASKAKNYER
jgi:hypothetical protein